MQENLMDLSTNSCRRQCPHYV